MAKFPRSNRKKFQIQRTKVPVVFGTAFSNCDFICNNNNCKDCAYTSFTTIYVVYGMINENTWGKFDFFKTKKEARQFIAHKRQAIKNREWEVNKL